MNDTFQAQLHREEKLTAEIHINLIFDQRVSDGAMRFYSLLHYVLRNQDVCKPEERSRKTFAKYLERSERTISTYIHELEWHDWIVVVERFSTETGSEILPFYHVFETQGSAIKFRQNYVDKPYEHIRDKPKLPIERKTRKGVGGRKPAQKTAVRGAENSISTGGGNLSSEEQFEVHGTQVQGDGGNSTSHKNTSNVVTIDTVTKVTSLKDSAAKNATDTNADAAYIIGGKNLNARKQQNDSQANNTPVQVASLDSVSEDQPQQTAQQDQVASAKDYTPVVCFAFNQVASRVVKDKVTGEDKTRRNTYVDRLTKWCRGNYTTDDRDDEWRQTSPIEEPVTLLELVGFAIWYQKNPRYQDAWAKEKSLPQTLSTLRNRLDEFRGAPGYTKAMELAAPKLAALIAGTPAPDAPKPQQQSMFQSGGAAARANSDFNMRVLRGEI